MSETRSEAIARWEASGWLDPACAGCREFYDAPVMPYDWHSPSHVPSTGCESGKRPHCTCDMCW